MHPNPSGAGLGAKGIISIIGAKMKQLSVCKTLSICGQKPKEKKRDRDDIPALCVLPFLPHNSSELTFGGYRVLQPLLLTCGSGAILLNPMSSLNIHKIHGQPITAISFILLSALFPDFRRVAGDRLSPDRLSTDDLTIS